MTLYVHDSQGQQRGPFDAATVVAMLQRNELDDRALCCASGETQWVAVREHPAIAPLLAPAQTGGWAAPAAAWSVGTAGSTWGTNSIPPQGSFAGPAQGGGAAQGVQTHTINSGGAAPTTGETGATGGAGAAGAVGVGASHDEAEEDAALGIPVEVSRPESIVPSPGAAVSKAGALEGARFVAANTVNASTAAQVEARRVARAQEGKARTNLVAGALLVGGVLVLGGLAVVGYLKRREAQAQLARAQTPSAQIVTSELQGDVLALEVSVANGTVVGDAIESAVRCTRARPPSAPDATGARREHLSCSVSAAPFGEQQRLRISVSSESGRGEFVTTFTRPAKIEVARDGTTGASSVQCRGARCAGTFDERDGLSITVSARTTVQLGRAQRDAAADGVVRVPIGWDELLAATPTRVVFDRAAMVPIDLTVRVPGTPALTARVELSTRALRAQVFRSWRAGQPALLPGEVPSSAGRRTLVAEQGESFGDPQTLRDVDLVAYFRAGAQSRPCRYTIAPRERRVMTVRREVASVAVFERRTARSVGTRRFGADFPVCPEVFSETEVPIAALDHEPIRRWLRGFVGG